MTISVRSRKLTLYPEWKKYYADVNHLPKNAAEGVAKVSLEGSTYTNILGSIGQNEITLPQGTSLPIVKSGLSFPMGKYLIFYNITATANTSDRNTPRVTYIDDTNAIESAATNYNTTTGRKVWKLDATKQIKDLRYWGFNLSSEVKVKEFMLVVADDATFNLSAENLLQKYSYINDTKSTVGASRVRGVGKNLFDGQLELGTITAVDGVKVEYSGRFRSANFTKIVPLTKYTLSGFSGTGNNFVMYYDEWKNYIFHYVDSGNSVSFTPPSNAKYILFTKSDSVALDDKIQLEQGTTATPYEPYTESNIYFNAGQELRSLPNGVADEMRNGVIVQRGQEYILQASNIMGAYTHSTVSASFFTDVVNSFIPNIANFTTEYGQITCENYVENIDKKAQTAKEGTFIAHTNQRLYFQLPLGTTLAQAKEQLAGTTIYYQLAEPVTMPIESFGTVYSRPSGTLYKDHVHGSVNFYEDGITVEGLFFSGIDYVARVDKNTGLETDITDTCTLNVGRNGFESTALQNGDLVWYELVIDLETTTSGVLNILHKIYPMVLTPKKIQVGKIF